MLTTEHQRAGGDARRGAVLADDGVRAAREVLAVPPRAQLLRRVGGALRHDPVQQRPALRGLRYGPPRLRIERFQHSLP